MDKLEIVVPGASGEVVFRPRPQNRPFGLEKEVHAESGILIVVGRE